MENILGPLILILYFAGYGIVHSVLASHSLKQWLQTIIGSQAMRGYRLVYNVFALLSLLPFFWLQTKFPNPRLYSIPSPWRWAMVGFQLLALVGVSITVLQTGLLHFAGISQLFTRKQAEYTPLNMSGFYRWTRHPLYSFSLLFMWLSPIMYLNQLIGYLLFSAYFFIGSIYEERKLVVEFGKTYQIYQQQVPRLIPRLKK